MKFIELSHFGRHKGKKPEFQARRFSPQHLASLTPDCIRDVKSAARRSNGVGFGRGRRVLSAKNIGETDSTSVCACVSFQSHLSVDVSQRKDQFWVQRSTKSSGKVSNQTDASSNLARHRGESVKIKKSVLLQTFVLFSSNF